MSQLNESNIETNHFRFKICLLKEIRSKELERLGAGQKNSRKSTYNFYRFRENNCSLAINASTFASYTQKQQSFQADVQAHRL